MYEAFSERKKIVFVLFLQLKINWPAHEILILITQINSMCSDQLAHSLSLSRAFTVPIHKVLKKMYRKTWVKRPLRNRKKTKILKINGSLMKVESIAECSPWSIVQYFWPALSDNWS